MKYITISNVKHSCDKLADSSVDWDNYYWHIENIQSKYLDRGWTNVSEFGTYIYQLDEYFILKESGVFTIWKTKA